MYSSITLVLQMASCAVHVLFVVLLVQLFAAAAEEQTSVVQQHATRSDPRDLPCPVAEDILPCVCTVLPDFQMNMDCSDVLDEDELARVFNTDFPVLDFNCLIMYKNIGIKVLRAGDLGQTTYKEIHITLSHLETVEPNALSGSYQTAGELDFYSNNITLFPFDELNSFTNLSYFYIQNNNLASFPTISSPTLSTLYMDGNPLGSITTSALQHLPNLRKVGLSSAGIQQISSGNI